MIVNARGNWWCSVVQNQGGANYTFGPAWDAQQELKTTINKQAQDSAIAAVEQYGPTYNTEGLRIGLASVRPGTAAIRTAS